MGLLNISAGLDYISILGLTRFAGHVAFTDNFSFSRRIV